MKIGGTFRDRSDMRLWFNFLMYLYGRNAKLKDVIANEQERSEVWWG